MKPKSWNPSTAAIALSLAVSSLGQAVTYYWDVDGGATSGTGGIGSWKNNDAFWRSGSSTGTLVDYNSWTGTDNDVVFAGTAGTVSINGPKSVNDITFDTAGYIIAGNTLTLVDATPTITANADATISSILAGSAGLIKAGTAKLTLSGTNTYTGVTDVQAGTLELGASNVFADTSTIKVSGGILSFLANSDTVAGVQLTSGSITSSSGVLTSTTAFDLQSGSVSAKLGGSVGVIKTTAGTVTLSGVNTYTGQTQVSGGKLTVDSTGLINSSSDVLISGGEFNYNNTTTALTKSILFSGTGGKLSGSGTIGSFTVTSGNAYSAGAGAAPGTQTTGGINFGAGSIFEWDLDINGAAEVAHDQVTATSLSGSGATFSVVLGSGDNYAAAFWNSDKSWNTILNTGSLQSVFSTIHGTEIIWDLSTKRGNVSGEGYFTLSGNTLNWTAVPEPSGVLVGLLVGAGLLRRRRI